MSIQALIEAGKFLDQKGLCPATSGNLSVRLDEKTALITASGPHKGNLTKADFLQVNFAGGPINSTKKPSAETLLHTSLYAHDSQIGAVLHTHSPMGTLLSLKTKENRIRTEGYELHKAFSGIDTHHSTLIIPIFENRQEIESLAHEIIDYLRAHSPVYGYLLRGHGLYTWGKTLDEAKQRVEAFEFLFTCEAHL